MGRLIKSFKLFEELVDQEETWINQIFFDIGDILSDNNTRNKKYSNEIKFQRLLHGDDPYYQVSIFYSLEVFGLIYNELLRIKEIARDEEMRVRWQFRANTNIVQVFIYRGDPDDPTDKHTPQLISKSNSYDPIDLLKYAFMETPIDTNDYDVLMSIIPDYLDNEMESFGYKMKDLLIELSIRGIHLMK